MAVVDHRVQVCGVHPGGGAGQPIAQFPFPGALAALSASDLDGHPATDLGQGLVGQLHQMEMVHDQPGPRYRVTDRRFEDRAHVDRHEPDALASVLAALLQPVLHRDAGTALDLPEQALTTGQVHEPDMLPIHRDLPTLTVVIPRPLGTSPADLIDPNTTTGSGCSGMIFSHDVTGGRPPASMNATLSR